MTRRELRNIAFLILNAAVGFILGLVAWQSLFEREHNNRKYETDFAPSFTRKHELTAQVFDIDAGEPLADAEVTVLIAGEPHNTFSSDADGFVTAWILGDGPLFDLQNIRLSVSKHGYETVHVYLIDIQNHLSTLGLRKHQFETVQA